MVIFYAKSFLTHNSNKDFCDVTLFIPVPVASGTLKSPVRT